jgi:hypothetical protein
MSSLASISEEPPAGSVHLPRLGKLIAASGRQRQARRRGARRRPPQTARRRHAVGPEAAAGRSPGPAARSTTTISLAAFPPEHGEREALVRRRFLILVHVSGGAVRGTSTRRDVDEGSRSVLLRPAPGRRHGRRAGGRVGVGSARGVVRRRRHGRRRRQLRRHRHLGGGGGERQRHGGAAAPGVLGRPRADLPFERYRPWPPARVIIDRCLHCGVFSACCKATGSDELASVLNDNGNQSLFIEGTGIFLS